MPERWASFALHLVNPGFDDVPTALGTFRLGLRRLKDPDVVAIVALWAEGPWDVVMRALLGIEQSDVDAALTDRVSGVLSQW